MKNIEYQENITEVEDIIQSLDTIKSAFEKRDYTQDLVQAKLVSMNIFPVIISDNNTPDLVLEDGKGCIAISDNCRHQLLRYTKLMSNKNFKAVLVQVLNKSQNKKTKKQIGMLVDIQSICLDKDGTSTINVVFDRLVKITPIALQESIEKEEANDDVYCKIEEVKFSVSNHVELIRLARESLELIRQLNYGGLYYLEWNNNLEKNPQYILKISEIILGVVYTKVLTEEIWKILCTTNLNEKFKIIIQLLVLQLEKETAHKITKLNLRDKKISEVSVIPKDYKIILFSAEMHQILTLLQPYRYLFFGDDRLILSKIEENYYAHEKQIILVGERKEYFEYSGSSSIAVLGDIKYVKRGVSHTSTAYIKPNNRVRLTDVVFKEGVFYGKTEEIKAIKMKNQEELDKIKNLTESVIKDASIYVSDIAIPIFISEIQNYEEYADNISFYIAEKLFDYTYNGCGARIKKEFYSYNVVERLFFLKEYLDTKRGQVAVTSNEDRVKKLIDSGKLKLKFSSNNDFKYEAIKAFNKAIMLDPKSIQEIGVLLAETYKELGRYEEAITIYSKIKTNDTKIELSIEEGKAWSYYLLSKYQECIEAYDEAMALGRREEIIAELFQVKSYLKLGMDEQVIKVYDKVLSKIDNDGTDKFYRVVPAIKKANILAGLKRYHEANKCYKEALDTYLNLPEPKWGLKIDMDMLYIHYAISLNAVNDKQKTHFFNISMERIKSSMAAEVRMRNIYCFLKAILLSAFGKLDEANICFDEIEIYVNLGGYEVPQIDSWLQDSLALKIYYNILLSSDHSISYLVRSHILSIWENYEEEKLCLEKILESKSDHAYVLCLLGIVCARLNQLDTSSHYFEKAIKCNGSDESTKVSSRWVYIEAGKVLNKFV